MGSTGLAPNFPTSTVEVACVKLCTEDWIVSYPVWALWKTEMTFSSIGN